MLLWRFEVTCTSAGGTVAAAVVVVAVAGFDGERARAPPVEGLDGEVGR